MSLKVSLDLFPTNKGGRSLPIHITRDPRNCLSAQLRTADGRCVDVVFMNADVDVLMPGKSYKVSFYATESVEALDDLLGVHVEILEGDKVIGSGVVSGTFGWLDDPWKKIGEEQRRRRESN